VHKGLSIQLLPQDIRVEQHKACEAGQVLHGAWGVLIQRHSCAGGIADGLALLQLQLLLLVRGVHVDEKVPGGCR
jgi:hypothetical protein